MTSSSSGLELSQIFDQFMVHHVQLGKLIFAPILNKTKILREIEAVASFLDDTMACSRCQLFCISSMHFLKGEGIVCDKCHGDADLNPEKEEVGCDILLTEIMSSSLMNTSIMTGFLLESLTSQAGENDGEESDDPEVQFPYFPCKTSPAKWNKSNAKLYLAAKKFLTRFEKPSTRSDDLEVDEVNVVNEVETRQKVIEEVKEEIVTPEELSESKVNEFQPTLPKIRFQGDGKPIKKCAVIVHRLGENNLAKTYKAMYGANYLKSPLLKQRSISKRSPVKSKPGPKCKKLAL